MSNSFIETTDSGMRFNTLIDSLDRIRNVLDEIKTAVTAAGTPALMPEIAVLAGNGHGIADWCCHVRCLLYR